LLIVQFEEASALMFNQWVPFKEAIEHCQPMALVSFKAKVIDVGETERVPQSKLKMAESIIFLEKPLLHICSRNLVKLLRKMCSKSSSFVNTGK